MRMDDNTCPYGAVPSGRSLCEVTCGQRLMASESVCSSCERTSVTVILAAVSSFIHDLLYGAHVI